MECACLVQVELQEASVGCALEVRDNGRGIAPEAFLAPGEIAFFANQTKVCCTSWPIRVTGFHVPGPARCEKRRRARRVFGRDDRAVSARGGAVEGERVQQVASRAIFVWEGSVFEC